MIYATGLQLSYGINPVLDHADFRILTGERACLIGRNGEGKSTLLRIIAGEETPEDGEIRGLAECKVATLPQELPVADERSVYEVVASGLAEMGALLRDYHALIHADEVDMDALTHAQQRLEAVDGWRLEQRITDTLLRFGLDPEAQMAGLSGGWRRRVVLARAIISEPDLLLLDEPTNHLDIPAIEWLEEYLRSFRGAVLFVSHDRGFIRRVANRVIELDRGKLTSFERTYDGYLEDKKRLLDDEEKANALFDKRLAQEEVWIRQGVKARRTRNEGRVLRLEEMRRQHARRRNRVGVADMSIESAAASGKIVAEAVDVSFGYPGQRPIIDRLNTLVFRGDKIGLVGENGAGKTTLVRLLLGQLHATSGTCKLGTQLEVAYFDQLKADLDGQKTVMDNLSEGREFITVGTESRHVYSYLGDFLFTPERARAPVRSLSGGERSRLMLAKLFSKQANVLVLDEPTNDLDVETLELLEELLVGFSGTVLLISHDREFLDNVVSSLLVLDGKGGVEEFVGGYTDWRNYQNRLRAEKASASARPSAPTKTQTSERPADNGARNKLSYKLKRELDELPKQIEKAEAAVATVKQETETPTFYQQDRVMVTKRLEELSKLQLEVERLTARWIELEDMNS